MVNRDASLILRGDCSRIGVGLWDRRQTASVITGLDPVIYLLRKTLMKMDGCADQVRA
jgi:hypothetical protein